MTHTILSKTISTAAILVLCATTIHAATLVNGTTGAGEILVGLRASGTFDSFGQTTNVVIDLGSAAALAALAPGTTVTLYNIGSDLASRFNITSGPNTGTAWYERPDLLWSSISGNTGTDISTNTLYAGSASSSPGTFPLTTNGWIRQGPGTQGGVTTNITSAITGTGGFNSSPQGSLSNVAIEDTSSNPQSWTARASAFFSSTELAKNAVGTFEQPFGPGALALGVEGALDVYRLVKTGTNDPDTGSTTGAGSYQFTLQINNTGTITATVLPVPEPASIGLLMTGGLFFLGSRRRAAGARTVSGQVA